VGVGVGVRRGESHKRALVVMVGFALMIFVLDILQPLPHVQLVGMQFEKSAREKSCGFF